MNEFRLRMQLLFPSRSKRAKLSLFFSSLFLSGSKRLFQSEVECFSASNMQLFFFSKRSFSSEVERFSCLEPAAVSEVEEAVLERS